MYEPLNHQIGEDLLIWMEEELVTNQVKLLSILMTSLLK